MAKGVVKIGLKGRGTSIVIAGLALSGLLVSHAVVADQYAAELPALFDQLSATDELHDALALEQQIWGHWLDGPDDDSSQLMGQIQSALQSGQSEFGLVLCNQLIDAYPDFAEAWNKRATFYFILNRLEESVADIQTTLELEPNHFGALSGLGLILMRTGDAEGALLAFEEVLKISPSSQSAASNAALARDQLGTDI